MNALPRMALDHADIPGVRTMTMKFLPIILLLWWTLASGQSVQAVHAVQAVQAVRNASSAPPSVREPAATPLRLGIVAYRPKQQAVEQWQPLISYLESGLGRRILLELGSVEEIDAAAAKGNLDIVIASPAQTILFRHRYGQSIPLATMVRQDGAYRLPSFGGVIFTRADAASTAIESLADLAKFSDRIAVTSTDSFGGFMMQDHELKKAGLPLLDKSRMLTTGMPQDRVVEAVLTHRADIGFTRTGVLEAMAKEGKLDPARIRIVHPRQHAGFPYVVSTSLYPEWSVSVAKHVDDELTRLVAVTFLALPHEGAVAHASGLHGFYPPLDDISVETMLREIRAPPFDETPEFTFTDVWRRHSPWLLILLLPGGLLLGITVGLVVQNRRVQQSKERFRNLFDASPDPIILIANGRYVDGNKAALATLGHTDKQQLLDSPVGSMAPEFQPDGESSRSKIQQLGKIALERTSIQQYDWANFTADGKEAVFSCNLTRVELDGQPMLLIVAHDITERKKAEQALSKANELLSIAQQAAQAGVWTWDMQTDQLQWSDALFHIMGLDPVTATASFDTWRARVHPEDLPFAEQQLQEAILDHHLLVSEYRFVIPNGMVRWVEAYGSATYAPDGAPLQMSGIVIDITKRKLTESLLRQSEDAWRLALESVGGGAWDRNVVTGQVNYSRQWKAILGYDEDEIGNTDDEWSNRVHPDDLSAIIATQQAIENGETRDFRCEARMRCKDGRYKWILTRGRVINADDEGRPIRVVGTMQDITERKQRELDLAQARQEAEQANIAKSRFLATMSHEIRTPMNGILGMAQMLMQPELKPAEIRDYAQTILNSGKSLLVLLNDILDLSKIEAGRIELESIAFNPRQILQEAQLLFDKSAGRKGLKIAAYWKGPIGQHYQGDPLRIGQMLANLVSNAIKFTMQGQICIEATEIERDGETALIEFSVADTGIGIPADKQHLLFQRFSQVDSSTTRQYGGSGLGLAIVAKLAAQMGGDAGLESREGSGSRFHFRVRVKLAQESAATTTVEKRNTATDAIPHLSGRVLVVEDDPVNRKVIKAMLNRLGVDVMMAEDGRQGVEAVMQGDLIDLVLMDIQMPVMSGDEATRRIRQWELENDLPRLPILALTADAFETDRQHCLAAGMDDVLAKPVDMKDLVALLKRWMPPPSWEI